MSETSNSVEDAFKRFEEEGVSIFYPDKVMGWCFRYIWLVAIAPLTLFLILNLLASPYEFWTNLQSLIERRDLVNGIYFSFTIAFLIGGLLFRSLINQTPRMLTSLAASGRLLPNPDAHGSPWTNFAEALRERIRSRWRWVLVALAVIIVGIGLTSGQGLWDAINSDHKPSETLMFNTWRLMRFVLNPLLLSYLSAGASWVMLTLGIAITKLTPAFEFNILPNHPDNSGGLGRLGTVTFNLMLPITLGVILFSFWAVLGSELPGTRAGFRLVMSIGAILLAFISIFAFFSPLWTIHQEMLSERAIFRDSVGEQIEQAEDELRRYLQMGKTEASDDDDGTKLQRPLNHLDALQRLRQTALDFPTWPCDRSILLPVFMNASPPLVGLGLQWLRNLLGFFPGS